MYKFKLIDKKTELEAIGNFRYDIYIREMHRIQMYADHKLKTIIEPEDFDDNVIIIVAYDGLNKIIGTSRIHIYDEKSDISALENYNIDLLYSSKIRFSEGSKFMIAQEYRHGNSDLGKQMIIFAYKILMENQVAVDLLNANSYLVDHYKSIGYRNYGAPFIHPELRDKVYPMILFIGDNMYFKKIGSYLSDIYIENADLGKVEQLKQLLLSK